MDAKDNRVLIIEDDPYARDLMAVLLTRDWRTRVVGEVGREGQVGNLSHRRVDVALLDTEIPGDPEWPFRMADNARAGRQIPMILCTGTHADAGVLTRVLGSGFDGYIIKGEVRYALASAVMLAAKGQWVTTRGVQKLAYERRLTLPARAVVIDGKGPVAEFTQREAEIARLAVLFSFAQRDLADELQIRPDEVGKLVSRVYRKLRVQEILTGELQPELYFEDGAVLDYIKTILKRVARRQSRAGQAVKAPEMATLAFHLLTAPEVEEV